MTPGAQLVSAVDRLLADNARDLAALEGRLTAAAGGNGPQSLMITSGRAGDGKTTVAISMAAGLARHVHARVLLVDGNLRAPRLSHLFGCPDHPGLTDVLRGDSAGLEPVICATAFERLWLVPRGTAPGGQLGRERSQRLAPHIHQVAHAYDYVIFDADSLSDSSDVALQAPALRHVAMVVAAEKTRWGALERDVDTLRQTGAEVVGAIINRRRRWIPENLYEGH